jgi:hypothetical protein
MDLSSTVRVYPCASDARFDAGVGYSLGAVEYLTKPVDRGLLHKALSHYYCAEEVCSVLLVEDDIDTREIMAALWKRPAGRYPRPVTARKPWISCPTFSRA